VSTALSLPKTVQTIGLKGVDLSQSNGKVSAEAGIVTIRDASGMEAFSQSFIEAIKEHRHWTRSQKAMVPA
jgi:catalase